MHTTSSLSSSLLVGSSKRGDEDQEDFLVPGGLPAMNQRMDRCQHGMNTASMKSRGGPATSPSTAPTTTPSKKGVVNSSSLRFLGHTQLRRKCFTWFSILVILFIFTTLCSVSTAGENEPPSRRPSSSGKKEGGGKEDGKGRSSPDAKDSERKKETGGGREQGGQQGDGENKDGREKLVAPPPLGRLKPTATREVKQSSQAIQERNGKMRIYHYTHLRIDREKGAKADAQI